MTNGDAPLLVEERDGALIMTLNRPDALNAQNQPMREALIGAVDRLESDETLQVGILAGAGRAFSAGADLKEMAAQGVDSDLMMAHFGRLWNCDKPLIAAVHGHAAGGGCELALLCDIRVATADAKFSQPEARSIGNFAPIAMNHLHHFVGRGEAMMIHLTGQPISGERAYQLGLAQRLVDTQEELLPAALQIADAIMQAPTEGVAEGKREMRGIFQLDAYYERS